MRSFVLGLSLASLSLYGAVLARAEGATTLAAEWRVAGVLTCDVGPQIGPMPGAGHAAACTFWHEGRRPFGEVYAAQLAGPAPDLGTVGHVMTWSVYSRGGAAWTRMLAGTHHGTPDGGSPFVLRPVGGSSQEAWVASLDLQPTVPVALKSMVSW